MNEKEIVRRQLTKIPTESLLVMRGIEKHLEAQGALSKRIAGIDKPYSTAKIIEGILTARNTQ